MLSFTKETKVVTEEEIEIKPGTYYFAETTDEETTYRRFIFEEERHSTMAVRIEADETFIRYEENIWYNVDYRAERCFGGEKGTRPIEKEEFDKVLLLAIGEIEAVK